VAVGDEDQASISDPHTDPQEAKLGVLAVPERQRLESCPGRAAWLGAREPSGLAGRVVLASPWSGPKPTAVAAPAASLRAGCIPQGRLLRASADPAVRGGAAAVRAPHCPPLCARSRRPTPGRAEPQGRAAGPPPRLRRRSGEGRGARSPSRSPRRPLPALGPARPLPSACGQRGPADLRPAPDCPGKQGPVVAGTWLP
jgi:hypothetical protein